MALLFAGAVMAQSIVSTTPENRNVIIEEYTGVNCQYCPDGHKTANQVCEANAGHAWAINIHQGGYAAMYTTQWGDALAGQTGLTGYPAGTVNRHVFSGNSTSLSRNNWSNAATQIRAMASPVNVAATATIDPNTRTLTVHVEAYYTGAQTVTTNKLNVALLQNNVFGPQTGASTWYPEMVVNGQYRHMHMLRHLLTGQWGEDITSLAVGTTIERDFIYQIPGIIGDVPINDFADLDVVVFICEGQQEILTGTKAEMTLLPAVYLSGFTVEENGCGIHYQPVVSISNTTADEATNFAFTFNNQQVLSSKLIAAGQTDTFHMPTYTIQYDNTPYQYFAPTLYVSFDNYDIVSTGSTENNGASMTYDIDPIDLYTVTGPLSARIGIDHYGSEASVELIDQSSCTRIWKEGPWSNRPGSISSLASLKPARYYTITFNPGEGLHILRLNDSYGDGWYMTVADEPAGIWLSNADGEIFSEEYSYQGNPEDFEQKNFYLNVLSNGDGTHSRVGINEAANFSLNVYPTVTADRLNIECSEQVSRVDVMDVTGRTVMTLNGNQSNVNVQALTAGVYMLRVVTEQGTSTRKFVKE